MLDLESRFTVWVVSVPLCATLAFRDTSFWPFYMTIKICQLYVQRLVQKGGSLHMPLAVQVLVLVIRVVPVRVSKNVT